MTGFATLAQFAVVRSFAFPGYRRPLNPNPIPWLDPVGDPFSIRLVQH